MSERFKVWVGVGGMSERFKVWVGVGGMSARALGTL